MGKDYEWGYNPCVDDWLDHSDEGNKHTYRFPTFSLDVGATVTVYTGSCSSGERASEG